MARGRRRLRESGRFSRRPGGGFPCRPPRPRRPGLARFLSCSLHRARTPRSLREPALSASTKAPSASEPASGGLLHAAGANARGAHADLFACALNHRTNATQVWIPAAPGDVVRVADRISIERLLAAKFTCECHVSIAPDWEDFDGYEFQC